jgi:riboflavin biosynthesis pyrimidine reductase
VITSGDAPRADIERLRDRVDVIAVGEGQIDWAAVLDNFSTRGWAHVLCEGGPSLHGELVELDLIDEVCLTIAPVLASGPAPRIAHGGTSADRPMALGHVIDVDGVLLTRWVRDHT